MPQHRLFLAVQIFFFFFVFKIKPIFKSIANISHKIYKVFHIVCFWSVSGFYKQWAGRLEFSDHRKGVKKSILTNENLLQVGRVVFCGLVISRGILGVFLSIFAWGEIRRSRKKKTSRRLDFSFPQQIKSLDLMKTNKSFSKSTITFSLQIQSHF